ncbi:MAG: hypothetical protein HY689_09310 [Chloroflexi bacterium]|nr:hypothetical protein [Chloroflexota bacterium]
MGGNLTVVHTSRKLKRWWLALAPVSAFTLVGGLVLGALAPSALTQAAPIQPDTHVTQLSASRPSADLDRCRNGGVAGPFVECKANGSTGYVNGNAGHTNAHWREDEFLPYRVRLDNLDTTGTSSVTIQWDVTKGGLHALDLIGSFDVTETTSATATAFHANNNDPCSDIVSGCNPASPDATGAIPAPNLGSPGGSFPNAQCGASGLTSFATPPTAGQFVKGWGVSSLSVSYVSQNVKDGDRCVTTAKIEFTATSATAVLAWAGHIAFQGDWGGDQSASAIDGSPYHMRLIEMATGGTTFTLGNQDRSLKTSAIIPTVVVNKVLVPSSDTGRFDLGVDAVIPAGTGDDVGDGGTTGELATSIGSHTAKEQAGTPSPGLSAYVTSVTCVDAALANVLTASNVTDATTRTGTFTVEAGDQITCVFTNTRQPLLEVIKVILNATAFDSSADDRFNLLVEGVIQKADAGNGDTTGQLSVDVGTNDVSETAGAGSPNLASYNVSIECRDRGGAAGSRGSQSATAGNVAGALDLVMTPAMAAGDDVVCTFTNDHIPQQGTLGGFKFYDGGTEGAEDIGTFIHTATSSPEPGLSGWQITVVVFDGDCDPGNDVPRDALGNPIDLDGNSANGVSNVLVTDSNGAWSTVNVPSGDYCAIETVQTGWNQTFPDGAGDNRTNVAFVATGKWKVTVGAGAATGAVNFGNVQKFRIIIFACNDISDVLVPASVTLDGQSGTTLTALGLPGGISESALCGLTSGASFGNLDADVIVGGTTVVNAPDPWDANVDLPSPPAP